MDFEAFPPATFTPLDVRSAIVSAYGAGFSQIDVALLLGISEKTVSRTLRRYHVPSQQNSWSPEAREIGDPTGRVALSESRDPTTLEYNDVLRVSPCEVCGAVGDIHVDHIEPLSKGGEDHWTNYAGLCASCNSSKRAESLLRWLLRSRVPLKLRFKGTFPSRVDPC